MRIGKVASAAVIRPAHQKRGGVGRATLYVVRNSAVATASTGHVESPIFLAFDLLNSWIASGVGCSRTLQPFFAK